MHEDVLSAHATGATSHLDPNFIKTYGEALEFVRQVVLTKVRRLTFKPFPSLNFHSSRWQDGQPFITAGSGTLGWDMTACNLLEQGEEVLVYNTGYFGDKFGIWYVYFVSMYKYEFRKRCVLVCRRMEPRSPT
jgi:alanine-glyoxylate transaminase/serine-glyoxylate transaminase/serine-pyruvate transaminase